MKATIELNELQEVFGQMREAYFFKSVKLTVDDLPTTDADVAMPLSDDGVTYEMGDPEITNKKITEGRNWYSIAKDGEADIKMQVPSVADEISSLFAYKNGEAKKVEIDGKKFKVNGYNTQKAKKVRGAWVFKAPEDAAMIFLPVTDNYGTFKGPVGDNWAYWNVNTIPYEDANGNDMYLFLPDEDEAEDAGEDPKNGE